MTALNEPIGKNPLSYVGVKETNPSDIYFRDRDPTANDFKIYDVGDIWVNTSSATMFWLTNKENNLASWNAAGTLATIVTDDGTASPTLGSITLTADNGLTTSAATSTINIAFGGVSSGYTGSQREYIQAGIQTTDATPTEIWSLALDEGEMVTLKGFINGFKEDYSECIGGDFLATFYRGTGGNVTVVGGSIININENSVGSPTFTLSADVGNQTVDIIVTGTIDTYNWVATVEYSKLLNDG